MFAVRLWRSQVKLFRPTVRSFRLMKQNPYTTSEVKLTEMEARDQETLPVWERVFDHKKYMEHEGPLKLSTGLSMVDVEPFPRLKLMKLYYMTLEEIRDMPDSYRYKFFVEEQTKFRMNVVDTTKSIKEIEEKISWGLVEELIIQAHNELKLMKIMKRWKPWEREKDFEDVSTRERLLNVHAKNMFPTPLESYKYDRHDKPPRARTAGIDREESTEGNQR